MVIDVHIFIDGRLQIQPIIIFNLFDKIIKKKIQDGPIYKY